MEGAEAHEPRWRAPHVSLNKRHGSKFFQLSYYWRGKQYRRTTRIKSKPDAVKLQQSLQLKLSTAFHVGDSHFMPYTQPPEQAPCDGNLPHRRVVLGRVLLLYRKELLHLSDRHRVVQGRRLDSIERRLGGRSVLAADVTTDVIRKYTEERLKEGVSATTVRNELTALSRAYHIAMAQDPPLIAKMPFSLASAPKATRFSNRAMPPALAAEVLSKLDLSLDTDRAILCALTLGLRSGDLTRKLSWENVDFEKGEVTLTTGKTGEVICNPLPPAVLERLRPHAKPSGLVCPLKNPSTAVPRRTQSLVGQRYGLHSMRKAYATGLANSGVNLKLVAQLLAHRSVLTSAGYVIPDDQAKREAVNRIGYLQPPEGE